MSKSIDLFDFRVFKKITATKGNGDSKTEFRDYRFTIFSLSFTEHFESVLPYHDNTFKQIHSILHLKGLHGHFGSFLEAFSLTNTVPFYVFFMHWKPTMRLTFKNVTNVKVTF